MRKLTTLVILALVSAIILFISCSKSGGGTTTPPNPCAGITITVTGGTSPTSTPAATNGSISASASGSSGFTFSLNGGTAQSSGTFSNLAVGSYTITAKDANGCTGSASFSVTATPCPTIIVTGTITQTSSPTATNGAIAASATGSTGFTYSINGISGTYQASGTFSNLAVGSYTIFAKDVNGCTGSAPFSVTTVSCPTISLNATPTNTSGPTATNGVINSSASGGATPYTYSKDGGTTYQASGTFNNLAIGNYSVVAKDANGCISATSTVTVGSTCPTINANPTVSNTVKCEPNNGSITITATGSSGFTYNLNGGTFQASNVFNSLATGNYTYGVKDGNGCTITGNANVAQAAAGTLFTQVKAIMAANCVSCHGGPFPQNGLDFSDDCTIVGQAARIKARAVDFNPSQMPPAGPPISAADRQKIVDWINAGGKHNN